MVLVGRDTKAGQRKSASDSAAEKQLRLGRGRIRELSRQGHGDYARERGLVGCLADPGSIPGASTKYLELFIILGTFTYFLFDLLEDPYETNNLYHDSKYTAIKVLLII